MKTILNLVILNLMQCILTVVLIILLASCAPVNQKNICVLKPYWDRETLQQLGYGPEDCCRYKCVPTSDYNKWNECRNKCKIDE